MKFLRVILQVLLIILFLTPISAYIQYKKINFYQLCLLKHIDKINPPCNEWKYVDTFLALPIFIVQKYTPLQFIWEEERYGARVCDNIHYGVKIQTLELFSIKIDCEPI